MVKTLNDIITMIQLGVGISVDAGSFRFESILDFVKHAEASGATIIIRGATKIKEDDLRKLIFLAPGRVVFEF